MKITQQLKGTNFIMVIYLAAGFIALIIVYRILTAIGLIKTAARKRTIKAEQSAEAELRTTEYFNPLFLKDKLEGFKTLGKTEARDIAAQIYKAVRGIGTNEEMIYSAFNRIPTKYHIAEISMYYRNDFKRDLLSDLLGDLTDKEQLILWNLISKKPIK